MSIFDSPMLDSYKHQCVLLERQRVSDGQGGSKTVWVDGMEFTMIFSEDTTTEALIAEQQGFTSTYHAVVARNMEIKFHDVIRRLSDGKIFRITKDGDDDKTPQTSPMDMKHLVLERWELPNSD